MQLKKAEKTSYSIKRDGSLSTNSLWYARPWNIVSKQKTIVQWAVSRLNWNLVSAIIFVGTHHNCIATLDINGNCIRKFINKPTVCQSPLTAYNVWSAMERGQQGSKTLCHLWPMIFKFQTSSKCPRLFVWRQIKSVLHIRSLLKAVQNSKSTKRKRQVCIIDIGLAKIMQCKPQTDTNVRQFDRSSP